MDNNQLYDEIINIFINKYPEYNNKKDIIYTICKIIIESMPNKSINFYLNFLESNINNEKNELLK